jgi:hypothetical protein
MPWQRPSIGSRVTREASCTVLAVPRGETLAGDSPSAVAAATRRAGLLYPRLLSKFLRYRDFPPCARFRLPHCSNDRLEMPDLEGLTHRLIPSEECN